MTAEILPGPWRQRCKAKSSQTGEPCRNWAMRGAFVCHAHGGRAPSTKAAAEKRLHELHEEAMRQLFGEFPQAVNTLAEVCNDPKSTDRDRIAAARTVVSSVVTWKARESDLAADFEDRDLRREINELLEHSSPEFVYHRMRRAYDDEYAMPDPPPPRRPEMAAPSHPSTNGHGDGDDVTVLVDALEARGLSISDIVEMMRELDHDAEDVDDGDEPE